MKACKEEKIAKIIEELKKDPGITPKGIEKNTGIKSDYSRRLLKELEKTENPEIKEALIKREEYPKGGNQLLKILRENPGLTYNAAAAKLKVEIKKNKLYAEKPEDIFKRLIWYCKKYQDKKIREIIVAHKKKGGWMP